MGGGGAGESGIAGSPGGWEWFRDSVVGGWVVLFAGRLRADGSVSSLTQGASVSWGELQRGNKNVSR